MSSLKNTEPPEPLARKSAFDTSFMILLSLALVAAGAVEWLKGPMRVVEISATYLGFLAVLSPKILCGFFIAASVPILVPRAVLAKWVGQESGFRGLSVATLAGALVPGGPMMIFRRPPAFASREQAPRHWCPLSRHGAFPA